METQVELLPDSALDRNWRNDFSAKLSGAINEVGSLAQKHQPGYRD
jgi:hypothetical protein